MSPVLETWANASLRGFRAGGAAPNSFELISTTISSGVTAVTFDLTGLSAIYKHLQLRFSIRSAAGTHVFGSSSAVPRITFNGDTGTNYNMSGGFANGNTSTTFNRPTAGDAGWIMALDTFNATSSTIYSNGIVDFIDCFATNKFKSIKGSMTALNDYQTSSWFSTAYGAGQWQNTAAATSLTITSASGNLNASSRLSLYGYKAV